MLNFSSLECSVHEMSEELGKLHTGNGKLNDSECMTKM
jgi:hypothetical protein